MQLVCGEPYPLTIVNVGIRKAEGLAARDKSGFSDPYCLISVETEESVSYVTTSKQSNKKKVFLCLKFKPDFLIFRITLGVNKVFWIKQGFRLEPSFLIFKITLGNPGLFFFGLSQLFGLNHVFWYLRFVKIALVFSGLTKWIWLTLGFLGLNQIFWLKPGFWHFRLVN